MLSAYINVNPGVAQNQEQAYEVRLRQAMDEAGVPEEVADRVRHLVGDEEPRARMFAIFADESGMLDLYRIQAELPETLRWGEPYTAPLMLALDEHEPYGVALLSAEEFRYFVVSPVQGPSEEAGTVAGSGFREVDLGPSLPYPRGGKELDEQSRRVEHNIRDWYNDLASLTRDVTFKEGVKRLILAGPRERTSEFRSLLPGDAAERVVAEEHVPFKAPEGDIMKRLEEVRQRSEHERAGEILAQIQESGVTGLERTLQALQVENRVYHLALLWDLEGEIRYSDHDRMAIEDITQTEAPSGAETRIRPLMDVLLDLAATYGARVDFFRGEDENATTLRDEFGGVAGLTRF